MTPDTRPGELPGTGTARKKLTFDPTINLGHLLTAAAMLATGFMAWSALDRRVAILEVSVSANSASQRERDMAQDQRLRETVDTMKESIQRIERGVDELRRGK